MNARAVRAVALLAVALLAVAACGDDGGGGRAGGNSVLADVPDADLGPTPGGAEVVLSYGTFGGLLPPLLQATDAPSLVLFGDGRLLQDVTTRDDDGRLPVAPVVEERRLEPDDVAVLADLLETAGVTVERDYGFPPIADAGASVLEVRVDDELVVNAVGAPGFDEDLTAAERRARDEFGELIAALTDLDTTLGPDAPEARLAEIDTWLVLTEHTTRTPRSDGGSGPAVAWPLDPARAADAAEPLVCTEVRGADRDAVLAAAEGVPDGTLWALPGDRFVEVALRPALEGEDCSGVPLFVER